LITPLYPAVMRYRSKRAASAACATTRGGAQPFVRASSS